MTFLQWLARSPLASALKVFVSVVLSMAVASWAGAGVLSLEGWQAWVIAAAATALPLIVNWLNPADSRYGRGSSTEGE